MKRLRKLICAILVAAMAVTVPGFTVSAASPGGTTTQQSPYVIALDMNGDGIVDAYGYDGNHDGQVDRVVPFNKNTAASSSIMPLEASVSPADATIEKNMPTDPVPMDYGTTDTSLWLSVYPTYGDWVYNPLSSTEADIVGYMGSATDVTIPATLGAYTVTMLDWDIFYRVAPYFRSGSTSMGNAHAALVTNVTIPDTVTQISGNFLDGTSVTSVYLPASVMYAYGIGGGNSLSQITVDPNSPYLTAIDGVLYDKGITQIESYPAQKTDAVYTLPSTVSGAGSGSFSNCRYIQAFAVSADDFYFSVNNGVLLSKDGTQLIAYPPAKPDATYATPSGVTTIVQGAFDNNLCLQNLVISEGVTDMATIINFSNYFNGVQYPGIQTLSLPSTLVTGTDWWNGNRLDIFYQMFALTSINVSSDNPVLSSIDGILYSKDMTVLYSYPIARAAAEYDLPSTVLTVAPYAFWNTWQLGKVVISASLTDFNAQSNVCDFQEVDVAADNAFYMSIDGVLYSKDGAVLVCYPGSKQDASFIVPDSVLYINTFAGGPLQTLTLPPNLLIMDLPGWFMTGNYSPEYTFTIIGKNDYARRWANYFGIDFQRIDATAAEVTVAMNESADILASLATATRDTLSLDDLVTVSGIIETYDSLDAAELAQLTPAQVAELDAARTAIADMNHTDGNVSLDGAAWNIRVTATQQSPSDPAYDLADTLLNPGDTINVLYDINLTMDGINYNLPAGQTMTVTINGNFTGQTVSTVRIFHLKEDYTTEYIVPLSVTATAITFVTTSFSPFGVVMGDASFIYGDVNGDGVVNLRDATLVMQYYAHLIDASALNLAAADVNGDSVVNLRDATLIMQYYAHLISALGPQ